MLVGLVLPDGELFETLLELGAAHSVVVVILVNNSVGKAVGVRERSWDLGRVGLSGDPWQCSRLSALDTGGFQPLPSEPGLVDLL